MEWQDLGPCRTRLVQDRLGEATWRDHDYVGDLLRIERAMFYPGGRHAAYVLCRQPLERAAIRAEVKEGRYMLPEEVSTHCQARDHRFQRHLEQEKDQEPVAERDPSGGSFGSIAIRQSRDDLRQGLRAGPLGGGTGWLVRRSNRSTLPCAILSRSPALTGSASRKARPGPFSENG